METVSTLSGNVHTQKICDECGDGHCNRKRRAAQSSTCRKKDPARAKASRDKHRQQDNEKSRARYYANRDKRLAQIREYYAENRGKVLARTKAYYEANEAKMIAVKSAWLKANRPKMNEYFRRRTAKKLGATIGNVKEIQAFYEMVKTVEKISCYWCQKPTPVDKRTIDHIYPIILGGAHAILNLCCACEGCNKGKRAKLPEDFAGGQMEMFVLKADQCSP